MAESNIDGMNRRRVLQGAAWTAPAVLIASASPAIAASSVVLEFVNAQLNDVGGDRAQIQFLVQNFSTPDTPIENVYVEVVYNGSGSPTLEEPGDPWTVSGSSPAWVFSDGDLSNNGATLFCLFYLNGVAAGDTVTITAHGTVDGSDLASTPVTIP